MFRGDELPVVLCRCACKATVDNPAAKRMQVRLKEFADLLTEEVRKDLSTRVVRLGTNFRLSIHLEEWARYCDALDTDFIESVAQQ